MTECCNKDMEPVEGVMLCGLTAVEVESATPCPCETCADYDRCLADFSGDYDEARLKIILREIPDGLPNYPVPHRRVVRNSVRTELAVYCARKLTGLPHAEIRAGLGLESSNDTTVICSQFKRKLVRSPALAEDVERILTRLKTLIKI